MPKQLLNEAERFLLERWGEARLLEKAMEDVRAKYKEVIERIVGAVTQAHPELNASAWYVTQFWGQGSIGFGRESWPGGKSKWPSGLWVEQLRLEVLAAEDSEPPYGSIWLSHKSNSDFDIDAARATVNEAAKRLLASEERKYSECTDADDVLLYFSAPSKSELLHALCEGDGEAFVALFVSQFDVMARFVPVLDKVFRECLRKE